MCGKCDLWRHSKRMEEEIDETHKSRRRENDKANYAINENTQQTYLILSWEQSRVIIRKQMNYSQTQ